MNRETMMMVAIAVALIASFYLYKENQKTKNEFESFKTLIPPPPPPPAPSAPQQRKKVTTEEEIDE